MATPMGGGGGEAAPATPEPVPEVPWPASGVQVAVGVEHLMHTLRLGDKGVSEGPAPDNPLEVIVKFDRHDMLASLRLPRSLLVPVAAPMRVLRFWDKIGEVVKRDLLKKVGVGDPREKVLPTTPSVSLTAWGEYLPLGLRYSEEGQCKFVPPAFVQAFEAGQATILRAEAGDFSMSFAELEDQAQRQEYRQKLLKNWWGQNEVLLVCMCDEASGSVGLLALRTTPMSVRFYLAPATTNKRTKQNNTKQHKTHENKTKQKQNKVQQNNKHTRPVSGRSRGL